MKFHSFFKMLSLFAVALLVGCAQPAKMEQMIVHPSALGGHTIKPHLSQSIVIDNVSGGQETNPLWTSEVSSEEFSKALEASLKGIGAFTLNNGRYALNAKLLSIKKPLFGFNMTVRTSVHYILTNLETKTAVFDKNINASYTATVGDAFIGTKRLQMANEGAIRENIRHFLLALTDLDLE